VKFQHVLPQENRNAEMCNGNPNNGQFGEPYTKERKYIWIGHFRVQNNFGKQTGIQKLKKKNGSNGKKNRYILTSWK